MIRSFKHKGLKRLYLHGDKKHLPDNMLERIEEILTLLDVATDLEDMDLPHFRLHPLIGNYKGFWSVKVRANWRIIFKFEDEPENVDFIDYH